MQTHQFDAAILGGGLAGTTLAWTLHLRGQKVLLVDRGQPITTSRIAAGLITPITGPKLALTSNWTTCRPFAESFYRKVERILGEQFFLTGPSIRLLQTESEQAKFHLRQTDPEYRKLMQSPGRPIPCSVKAPWGGFEMPTAARLNLPIYLDGTQNYFKNHGCFEISEINLATDLNLTSKTIRLPAGTISAKKIFLCQGYVPGAHPWFDCVRFNPAKGEILTLSIPELQEQRPLHSNVWLAPTGQNRFLAGSTFEWQQLDNQPTSKGCNEILGKLAEWLTLPFKVVDQKAAIRPTMHDFKPVLGRHPDHPHLLILNGLGTRGSLLAPWLAHLLADHALNDAPLPPDLDVQRWFR